MSLTLAARGQAVGVITLLGSKSLANRALLLASLAHGSTEIVNLPSGDDVNYLLQALHSLGVCYYHNKVRKHCIVLGCNGPLLGIGSQEPLFLGNAGTVLRPLTAILSLTNRQANAVDYLLTGDPQMQERPIAPLVEALQQGGAIIDYIAKPGYPPLRLRGGFRGGNLKLTGEQSSQFISALLMASPLAAEDTTITINGPLVSRTYITMTLQMMRRFGIEIVENDQRWFTIPGRQRYQAPSIVEIEGDVVAASYFLAAAAISGGRIQIKGIGQKSQQGEKKFSTILQQMGAQIYQGKHFLECRGNRLVGIEVDMRDEPDSAMTLAIVALFAQGPTTLHNIHHWRFKECNRLTAMAEELAKIGAQVEVGTDFLRIHPPVKFQSAFINTYHDHRMAMCFSLVTLAGVSVTLSDANCVSKSFPDYFTQFYRMTTLNKNA